jgi:hypothetical protein
MWHTSALILSLLFTWTSGVLGFVPSSNGGHRKLLTPATVAVGRVKSPPAGASTSSLPSSWTVLQAQKSTTSNNNDKKSTKKNSNNADFAYQEMRAILTAMAARNIQTLEPLKRTELESYITQVVQQRIPPQPVALTAQNLVNTKYRLAFSNQDIAASNLPNGAAVLLEFTSDQTLNYRLQFAEQSKGFGLQNMNAQCSYTLDEETGLLKYVYENITTDLFGMQNLPVGLFGQLKGRTSYIVSSYYDGDYWIEIAYGSPQQTSTYTNVYVRVK